MPANLKGNFFLKSLWGLRLLLRVLQPLLHLRLGLQFCKILLRSLMVLHLRLLLQHPCNRRLWSQVRLLLREIEKSSTRSSFQRVWAFLWSRRRWISSTLQFAKALTGMTQRLGRVVVRNLMIPCQRRPRLALASYLRRLPLPVLHLPWRDELRPSRGSSDDKTRRTWIRLSWKVSKWS